jgi:hypothetical protein
MELLVLLAGAKISVTFTRGVGVQARLYGWMETYSKVEWIATGRARAL